MSKTFIYSLLVIGVYLLIIFPKMVINNSNKTTEKEEKDKELHISESGKLHGGNGGTFHTL